MTKTPKMGRASIFRGKAGGMRVQGIITAHAAEQFESHRVRLESLYRTITGKESTSASDADVIEYLARGHDRTAKYLRHNMPRK